MYVDTAFILPIVMGNTLLNCLQEYNADSAAGKLRSQSSEESPQPCYD